MRKRVGVAVLLVGCTGWIHADDWPQWRGPHGNGLSTEKGLPRRWNKESLAWKAPLGGLGVSSPVVWGERIFVTSQAGRGIRRPGVHPTLARGEEASAEKPLGGARAAGDEGAPRGVEFLVEAFHRKDGRRLWQYRFASEGDLPSIHDKHNLASPSPVTDGRQVYAWFGTGQLVALDMDGRLAWQRNIAKEYSPFEVDWGHGSSPALYGDLLYLLCDHKRASYLLALDKRTGKEKWKADRGKDRKSHSTPTLVAGPRGDELIVNSSERIDAYDPRTGDLLWHTGEANRFPIPVPAHEGGVLYASRGYRSGPYMAIRTGGRGDVTRSHVQWSVPTGAPYVSSLVHYDGLVYMANDAGIVTCVDAKTGDRVWQERIAGIFTASPVAGDGKVYLLSETGEVIVMRAGREPRVLERNAMDERMVASPAVSDGQIFIRTDQHVVGIGRGSRR